MEEKPWPGSLCVSPPAGEHNTYWSTKLGCVQENHGNPAAPPGYEDSHTVPKSDDNEDIMRIKRSVELTTGGVVRIGVGRTVQTRLRNLHHVVVHKLSFNAATVCKCVLSLK